MKSINEDSQIALDATGSGPRQINFRIGGAQNDRYQQGPLGEAGNYPSFKKSILKPSNTIDNTGEKKYVNVDFFDWLQNR